jgi:phospholipase/carboxylesterase
VNEKNSSERITINGWPFRVSIASKQTNTPRVLLLLHGHLGNENVMWIFAKPLVDHFTILSPRAPQKMGDNQFSWHKIGLRWPGIKKYQALTDELLKKVNTWLDDINIHVSQFDLMGFSQGAVMAYALAILQPEIIRRVAVIAGFIPNEWKSEIETVNLEGKHFFVAHGKKDEIIPVRRAYNAQTWLRDHGAQVNFCEADIGHKIGANCFNGLEEFFT